MRDADANPCCWYWVLEEGKEQGKDSGSVIPGKHGVRTVGVRRINAP
jgi:hypothetical protein